MTANYLKAGLLCLCWLGLSNNSVTQGAGPPIKNIVLVHGAWADGSGWKASTTFSLTTALTSALSRSRRHHLRTTLPLQNASLLNKMDSVFLSPTAMVEP